MNSTPDRRSRGCCSLPDPRDGPERERHPRTRGPGASLGAASASAGHGGLPQPKIGRAEARNASGRASLLKECRGVGPLTPEWGRHRGTQEQHPDRVRGCCSVDVERPGGGAREPESGPAMQCHHVVARRGVARAPLGRRHGLRRMCWADAGRTRQRRRSSRVGALLGFNVERLRSEPPRRRPRAPPARPWHRRHR